MAVCSGLLNMQNAMPYNEYQQFINVVEYLRGNNTNDNPGKLTTRQMGKKQKVV
jgi:hypothetical protein